MQALCKILCSFIVALITIFTLTSGLAVAQSDAATAKPFSARRPVIYVMPNPVATPGETDGVPVLDTSHNGREPQVAKTYQELQHEPQCKDFAENMLREKADYFLLLQHGGGLGNRWAVSNKNGDVIASGETVKLSSSVKDACAAVAKDWQAQVSAQK